MGNRKTDNLSSRVIEPALERLARLARERGFSMASLAEAMGKNRGYLSTAEAPHLSRLLDGADAAGLSPRAFCEGLFVDRRQEPRLLLAQEREAGKYERAPFLDACQPTLTELATRAVDPAPAANRRGRIEALEDLRFTDVFAARAKLEALIQEIFADLAAGATKPAPSQLLADLAAAFTGWAATARMKGQRDATADALDAAFALAARSGSPWALGLCYKRGAFLMRDLTRPDVALDWVDESTHLFVVAGEGLAQQELLVDRGVMLEELGATNEAEVSFRAAIACLPGKSFRYLASAHHGLAVIAQKANRLEEATKLQEAALAYFPKPDYAYAHGLWRLGSLQLERGWDWKAVESLRRALALLQLHGSLLDVAYLAIDIASTLLRTGRLAELDTLVNDLEPWMVKARPSRLIRLEIENLTAMIRLGGVSSEKLDLLRDSVQAAANVRRRPR